MKACQSFDLESGSPLTLGGLHKQGHSCAFPIESIAQMRKNSIVCFVCVCVLHSPCDCSSHCKRFLRCSVSWGQPGSARSSGCPLLCSLACHHAGRSWQPLSVCLFTIDDTGCPTSQSVSPSKTPSGSEQSARGSPTLPERAKTKVKRVRVMTEWSGEARSSQRHKRELRSAMKARGKPNVKGAHR